MDAEEKTITLFTTRVRQMILQYDEMKNENARLKLLVEERDSEIMQLEELLTQAKKEHRL